jgi:hypothetical protein
MTEAGEIIVRSQIDGVTSLSLGIEPEEVLTFIRDNFPEAWEDFIESVYRPGVDDRPEENLPTPAEILDGRAWQGSDERGYGPVE